MWCMYHIYDQWSLILVHNKSHADAQCMMHAYCNNPCHWSWSADLVSLIPCKDIWFQQIHLFTGLPWGPWHWPGIKQHKTGVEYLISSWGFLFSLYFWILTKHYLIEYFRHTGLVKNSSNLHPHLWIFKWAYLIVIHLIVFKCRTKLEF